MIISINESHLILIDHCYIGLKGLYNFSEESIVLHYIVLQFSIDTLQTDFVIELCIAFELHNVVNGVNEFMLEETGRLNALNLLEE